MRPFTILSTALTLTPNAYADAVPPVRSVDGDQRRGEKADARPTPAQPRTTPKWRFRSATSPLTRRSPPPAN